jgi:hypothetical protein
MAMKRRSFLTMLGAAVAAPAASLGAAAMPANIGGLAATHAKTYPFVSATGLSRRLGLSISQAQQVLVDLSRKGIVGPVQSCNTGPIHAASKVFTPTSDSLIRLAQTREAARKAKAARALEAKAKAAPQMQVDLTGLLRRLHTLCAGHDMTLQPRALAAVS